MKHRHRTPHLRVNDLQEKVSPHPLCLHPNRGPKRVQMRVHHPPMAMLVVMVVMLLLLLQQGAVVRDLVHRTN